MWPTTNAIRITPDTAMMIFLPTVDPQRLNLRLMDVFMADSFS
jgi:hypothetical protein